MTERVLSVQDSQKENQSQRIIMKMVRMFTWQALDVLQQGECKEQ